VHRRTIYDRQRVSRRFWDTETRVDLAAPRLHQRAPFAGLTGHRVSGLEPGERCLSCPRRGLSGLRGAPGRTRGEPPSAQSSPAEPHWWGIAGVAGLPANGERRVTMQLGSRSTGLLVLRVSLIALTAALGIGVGGGAIAAPPSPEPNLDHFRCYSMTVGQSALPPIATLEDQFDRGRDKEEVFVGLPISFCNPVAKTIPGPGQSPGQTTNIRDPNAHLMFYEIHETTKQRRLTWKVTIDNQFGRQTLFAIKPVLLGVPTLKFAVDGVTTGLGPPFDDLNHFKCYRAKGRTLNVAVTLADQFESAGVIVVEPILFCNPVEKIVTIGGVQLVTPIVDPEAHLTCYDIDLAAPIGFSRQITITPFNQFIAPGFPLHQLVTNERALCVPSAKVGVLGLPGSLQAP
jgi:hypothetical protein